MQLSAEQIEYLREVLNKNNIRIETLRDDLLDHLCCTIEIEMKKGEKFDVAFKRAIHDLAPDGLEVIQRQTLFLLNSTKIMIMKKVMYLIGLLSAMVFVLGWTFGMMHWPGAAELSVLGFLGFVIGFVPLYTFDYLRGKNHFALNEKLRLSLGIFSGFVLTAALFFKLLHLPGADTLLLSGVGIFVFGFLPLLFFRMYKKSVA